MPISKLPQLKPLTQPNGGRSRIVFPAIALFAFVIRLLYLWGQVQHNPMFDHPMTDALQHHTWAQLIASGQSIGDSAYYRAPLYYYLLGLVYVIAGPSVIAGKLMGCIVGAMSCLLIGMLASALGGQRAGILAALLSAVYWPFIYFDAELLTVGLEICLNTLTLLLLVQAGRRKDMKWFAASGAALGLAAITRPNILAFVPFIGVWCILIAPAANTRWRFALSRTAAVCVGAALFILPVTIRNYRVSGEIVLVASTSGVNFYIGNNPEADGASAKLPGIEGRWGGDPEGPRQLAEREMGRRLTDTEVSGFYFGKGLDWIKQNPTTWAVLLLKKLRSFWGPYELPNNQSIVFFAGLSPISAGFWIGFPIVAALAGGGLFTIRHKWRNWFPLIAFGLVHMLTIIVFFCPARYRLPIVPVLIVLSSAGLSYTIHAFRRRTGKWKPYAMICGGCALLMLAGALGGEKTRRGDLADGHYRLGSFYAAQADEAQTGSKFDAAIAEFRKAIELDHPGPSAQLSLAHALYRSDRTAEAELEYRGAVREYPDDLAAQRKFGEFLAMRGRDSEAAKHFRQAIQINPLAAEAHQELGCLYIQMGRLRQAVKHLGEALRLDPSLTRARIFLSQTYAMQGNYDAAMNILRESLLAQPDQLGVLLTLGNLQINAGQPEDAIATFEKAMAIQADVPKLTFGYATALRLVGRRADAIESLQSQIAAAPNDPQCLALLAWIRATAKEDHLRNGREAETLAERAVALLSPPTPEALDAQAAAFAELGRFEDAARVAHAAMDAAVQAQRPGLARKIGKRARRYASRQPYRE